MSIKTQDYFSEHEISQENISMHIVQYPENEPEKPQVKLSEIPKLKDSDEQPNKIKTLFSQTLN